MSKEVAFLEYSIMFDPTETGWTQGYEFEHELAAFFTMRNFSSEIIETRGGTGRRIIYLFPNKDILDQATNVQPSMVIKKLAGEANGGQDLKPK